MNPIEKEVFLTKERYTMADLLAIMEALRAEDGCAWDRAQTHASIRRCLLEEAYEVADAIDKEDAESLCEELGDLLFQIVFHAEIEREVGNFSFADLVDGISKKMLERHPHVFAHPGSDAPDWNAMKAAKRRQTKLSERLDEVPAALPALMRADKLLDRIEQTGGSSGAYLTSAETNSSPRTLDHENVGDSLLALVADCRKAGIDCERALADACDRLIDRVKADEDSVHK